MRVFDTRVLSKVRVLGPKKDSVTGVWRKLHKERHNLYSSPIVIRMIKLERMRWARHVARMEKKRNTYRIWKGKPEGRRRRRWVDNINMDLR
jgi:hypothetical protein